MTGIRVNCHECATESVVSAHEISLDVYDSGVYRYQFSCPACRILNVRPADSRARALLKIAAAPVRQQHMPAEFLESAAMTGAPLTEDDLLDFSQSFRNWCRMESAWQESDLRHPA